MTDEDPGWWQALRVLVPFAVLTKRARQTGSNALVPLRMSFLAFVMSLLLFGFVLTFVTADAEKKAVPPWVVGSLIVLGSLAIGSASWSRRRPLHTTSPFALANSYRTNLFVGIALSESPALVAFGACVLTGRLWLYAIGLAASLISLSIVAPTASSISQQQERITSLGSPLSLLTALAQPVTRSPNRPDIDPRMET